MKFRLIIAMMISSTTLVAQETDGTPLSAIDWLSRSVAAPASPTITQTPPPTDEEPVAQSGMAPDVTTTPLDAISPDAVGLLASDITGLPRSLWAASEQAVVIALLQATQIETLPASQDLLFSLLLAEADPPAGATIEGQLFLARVDKLLDIGALEPAQAMLEAANPDTPELYRRWFDISLLTGTEHDACSAMQSQPGLAPTYPARIFCLARNGDWMASALTLNTARALGQISIEEEALLSRFLDPELFEGVPDLPAPGRISPLVFRMREAIGEAIQTSSLPRAFSHADLRNTTAWRFQITASERLIRVGAVADSVLFGFYVKQRPSASGGVWERAAAIQSLESAFQSNDHDAVAGALPDAWAAMQEVRAEVAFARQYSAQLQMLELTGSAARLANKIGLLAPEYAENALSIAPVTRQERLWQAIASDDTSQISGTTPNEQAILDGFTETGLPAAIARQIENDQLGETLLRTIALLQQGFDGDPSALRDGLIILRHLDMDDSARRIALQFLILDWPS